MNSQFDPECHRQIFENRQEAKEQKRGGEKREEGELVLQGVPYRRCRAEATREATPKLPLSQN